MKNGTAKPPHLYPEQNERCEIEFKQQPISRRRFFKRMGLGIASFVVASDIISAHAADFLGFQVGEDSIAAWIHVNEEGKITVMTGKVEVGQNIRTSLAQAVAEELYVSMEDVHLIMGDTQLTPYDRGTYGSLTTPQMAPILRKAAASIREMLKEVAASDWSISKEMLRLAQGIVYHPTNGTQLCYAALAKGQRLLKPVNQNVALVPATEWQIAGKSIPKVGGALFITGKHRYVSDMVLPDMQYGKVLRAPSYGAKLIAVNTEKAAALPGVRVVREGDFVAVTAPDSQTATLALALIESEWEKTAQVSRDGLFTHLKASARDTKAPADKVKAALDSGVKKMECKFLVDYIAHVPLEPRAGLAEWKGDAVTVWTGTQRPFGVQEELQRAFGMPKEKIRVIMPDTGSGYGGKHTGEAGIEAARLAKAIGRPVKVIWTREEEFKWAYVRPAGVIEVSSASDQNGSLVAWEMYNYNSGGAGIEIPYDVAAKHHQYIPSDTPLRQGSYRALASTANIFAIESQVNDHAVEFGIDPLAFREQHLSNERLLTALRASAKKFGWGKAKSPGTGFGIACGTVKGGYVGTCAEVQVDANSGEVSVKRLVVSFECGAIINPRHLEGQVIGCVLQGLGGALFEAVDFKDGEVLNPFLSTYRVPRFRDVPAIEVVLINRKDLPSAGAGEAPIVGVAPAIRNAIYDASGVRLYSLPLVPGGRLNV
ncbi:xanthine dehydrogenase family protein molybdopterin-binding subunit [Lunatimonas salinarum]|uniref:xanthine dehydrogenase family protein molybdopterin-binding subunit n=1 Tax=Lunatimonas salinarum TaxID=1774590 RepID=UPI001AE01019|nr:molybdopterin cofactor-binding domain-containing protein [Lunatimonas salinarum]